VQCFHQFTDESHFVYLFELCKLILWNNIICICFIFFNVFQAEHFLRKILSSKQGKHLKSNFPYIVASDILDSRMLENELRRDVLCGSIR